MSVTVAPRRDTRAAIAPALIGHGHPICRGGYAAIVLCGRNDLLGEIAGEPTAHTRYKFVLPDPALRDDEDFARSGGSMLQRWPERDIRPIGGMCFVFTNAQHAAIERLLAAGAEPGEHFIVAAGLAEQHAPRDLEMRLADLVRSIPQDRPIVILGYGRQGRRIAACLRDRLAIPAERLRIHDRSAESRAAAQRDGLIVTDDDARIEGAAAVIASPLARYPAVRAQVQRARAAGVAVFDNAQSSGGLDHWQKRGRMLLDEAAARVFRIEDDACIVCDEPALRPLLSASIIREDERVLGGVRLPQLQSGQAQTFAHARAGDLGPQWPGDGLAAQTFGGFRRGFVSLGDRADLGLFAARELCCDVWPEATRQVFPSRHVLDLGATAFERLLKGHLDAREIVSTMQTPVQRVTLGIAAAHYAAGGGRPVIEIGSAFGGSALLMAAATAEQPYPPAIRSIDPDAPTRDIMRFAFAREGYGDRLLQIVKTSDDAIAELKHLRDACGLVFIDGLHTRLAVERDFSNFAPLVANGGALLFHDVCPAIHSVMQAVIECVLPDKRFKAVCLVDGLLIVERVA
jgi:predicted O-methyltransferase YrrM